MGSALPRSIGSRSIPSNPGCAVVEPPASATIVAVRSIVMPTWESERPAGNATGQRKIAGTRIPPSHNVSLRWKKGALRESHSPPLSLVKTTSVLLGESPRRQRFEDAADAGIEIFDDLGVVLTARRDRRRPAIAAIEPFLRAAVEARCGDWNGQWGAPYVDFEKERTTACVSTKATARVVSS